MTIELRAWFHGWPTVASNHTGLPLYCIDLLWRMDDYTQGQ